jgi:1,4-alpha-glucan branching enzyme
MAKHHKAAESKAKNHAVSLQAPGARAVAVTGNFCGWVLEGHPLKHETNGLWKTTLALVPGHYEYRFLIDGEWHDDPACSERVPNPFGSQNCVFRV